MKERKGIEMIKDVPLTGIFVNDQDAALDFYTNKLGLELIQDEPYGESGARWIKNWARCRPRAGRGCDVGSDRRDHD
jgi:catechol 2,3-dioxygenase-like lactoylglutathione lyase family enzyme